MTRSIIPWERLFDVTRKRPGASNRVLAQFTKSIGAPLSARELKWLQNIQPEPEKWRIPNRLLPSAYLDFLRWSNGGHFEKGDRIWDFFPATGAVHGFRVMMLAYGIPHYSPGILPFAFNGSGIFYGFDMRRAVGSGNYPIVAVSPCNSDPPIRLEQSFRRACRSRTAIEDLWFARYRRTQ